MNARDQQVRTWSMLCNLSALAGLLFPFGNLLGPLLVLQIKKNELPEIDSHGKESLNFQITMIIISIIFSIFLLGSLALLLGFIKLLSIALVVIASFRANSGEPFSYPSIKFLR